MPTELAYKSGSRSKRHPASALIEALSSDDLMLLLLWTATGLAVSLGLAAFGLQPDLAQNMVMFG